MSSGDDQQKIELTKSELRELVRETVNETLTSLGVQHDSPLEMQRDFRYLREWRMTTDRVKIKTIVTIIVTVTSGAIAAIWMGLKTILNP